MQVMGPKKVKGPTDVKGPTVINSRLRIFSHGEWLFMLSKIVYLSLPL